MTRLAVLLTSHDRRESTLACLERVARQDVPADIDVWLADAGSEDGTPEAVAERFPEATVLRRGPELYWNAGMRVAYGHAHARGYDAYLWLNDDTMLDDDALARLLTTEQRLRTEGDGPGIVVGATRDADSGEITYSGVVRPSRARRLRWERVQPAATPRPVETMNGNCVLIPAEVADRVGNLDPRFTHGMGDFDYGLRARRLGFPVVLAPGTVGTCASNPRRERPTIGTDWRDALSVKGLPPEEWLTFARRWAGPVWTVFFVSPYLRQLLHAVRRRVRGRSLRRSPTPPGSLPS